MPIHEDFCEADFIMTPRAILFLMMRQAEGRLDFLHGEKVLADSEKQGEHKPEKNLPQRYMPQER